VAGTMYRMNIEVFKTPSGSKNPENYVRHVLLFY